MFLALGTYTPEGIKNNNNNNNIIIIIIIIQHLYSALKSCKGYGGAGGFRLSLSEQVWLVFY